MHVFTEQPNGLILRGDTYYKRTGDLPGRGQAGIAFFCAAEAKKSDEALLIKQDELAICFLESTASFLLELNLLPNSLNHAVNYAEVGLYTPLGETEPLIVSVQQSISAEKSISLDKLLLGFKRTPKTLISTESWYSQKVRSGLERLPAEAQWSLAAGILLSVLAGDESLHIGQFMALLSGKEIVGIKRIDLGARNRYAIDRSLSTNPQDLSAKNTSTYYQSTGQFNKSYIDYLLNSPSVARKYQILSERLLQQDKEQLKQKVFSQSFILFTEQINRIPEAQLPDLFQAVEKIIQKQESSTEAILNKDKFIQILSSLEADRVAKIRDKIQQDSSQKVEGVSKRLEKLPENLKKFQEKIKTEEEKLKELNIHSEEHIILYIQTYEVALYRLETMHLESKDLEQKKAIELEIKKYAVLLETYKYLKHKPSREKQRALLQVHQGDKSLKTLTEIVQKPIFRETICQHSSIVSQVAETSKKLLTKTMGLFSHVDLGEQTALQSRGADYIALIDDILGETLRYEPKVQTALTPRPGMSFLSAQNDNTTPKKAGPDNRGPKPP